MPTPDLLGMYPCVLLAVRGSLICSVFQHFWPLNGGELAYHMGLVSADSLAQQVQHAGAGLYWATWVETPQGTARPYDGMG